MLQFRYGSPCPFRVYGIITWKFSSPRFYTVPSSSTASWHGLYKPLDLHEGERKVKLQSWQLFYNASYSYTHVRNLGVTFYGGIS